MIGAGVYVLVAAALMPVVSPLREAGFDRLFDDMPEMSPEARELMEMARGPAVGIAVGFVLQLGLGMIFSTIGGLLGALAFRKAPPRVPPRAAPPPPQLPDAHPALPEQ